MQNIRRFVPRHSRTVAVAIALTVLLVMVAVVAAVQFGELDGDDHPHVGLLVFDVDGSPAWRCSGTLLSPTVMVTAGHCTFGTSGGRVWFEPDVESGIPDNGYPFGGGTSIEFKAIYTHPQYDDNAFYLHDVGVVILRKPVKNLENYGTLAEIGLLDELATRRGQQDRSFTVVGYGLQSVVPTLQQDRVRYQGTVQLVDVNGTAGIPGGTSASFTNNPGEGNGEGGTCFGDSGGPIFHGDSNVIAAITSYGLNANCAGTGGGYRVDTVDDQAFINGFLD
ncbi:MAG TPA: trypsin-like serine protease [Anaerolineae bacterium]